MLTIRAKFSLSFLLITLIVALLFGVTAYTISKKYIVEYFRAEMLRNTAHLASDIERFLTNKQQLLTRVAAGKEVQDFPINYRTLALARYFDKFDKEFPALSFINEGGVEEVYVDEGQLVERSRDFSQSKIFKAARQQPDTVAVFTEPNAEEFNKPTFVMGLGIRQYFGDVFEGVLVGKFPFPPIGKISDLTFHDSAMAWPSDSDHDNPTFHNASMVWLLDPNFSVVSASKEEASSSSFPEIYGGYKSLLLSEQPAINLVKVAGKDYFLAHVPIAKFGLHLVSSVDYEALISPAASLRNVIIVLGLFFSLFFGVLAAYAANFITKPIRELTDEVANFKKTHRHVTGPKASRDEVGRLVSAFNSLVDDLNRTTVSKEYFDNIIQHLNNLLIVTAADDTIQVVNRVACEKLGAKEEELIGRPLADFVAENANGHDLFEGGDPSHALSYSGERLFRSVDGHEFPVLFSRTTLQDQEGNIEGFVCIAQDLTERKLLEKQLRQSQKMEAVGTLAGGIAHDFNNILTAIIGFAELGKLSEGEVESNKEAFDTIFKSGVRAQKIVEQLLTFSRKAEKEKVVLLLPPLIKESVKLVRATFPTTIGINQRIDENCRAILADPTQIQQIILNLCNNAAQAMKERGGQLTIELAEEWIDKNTENEKLTLVPGEYARLSISDTGHGIPPEIIERIFDPFFTTKEVGEGTGLGLSVVHGIVSEIGGQITVDSTLDKGTVFNVYLPLSKERGLDLERSAPEDAVQGSGRILIVDDEEAILVMMNRMLTHLGYEVVAKLKSTEALEAFRANPSHFDLVITDQMMPELTGMELTKQLREIREDIAVILYSGYNENKTAEELQEIGVKALLTKPLNMKELSEVVGRVLSSCSVSMTAS